MEEAILYAIICVDAKKVATLKISGPASYPPRMLLQGIFSSFFVSVGLYTSLTHIWLWGSNAGFFRLQTTELKYS